MKKFLPTYAICLVFMETFIFFGGFMLFDFSNGRHYRAGATIALVLAIAVRMWLSTENRVENLKKELRDLKEQNKSEHSESEDIVS